MNPAKIMKLLELADRESTNPNEALNALRLVKSALEQVGLSWSDLPDVLADQPRPAKTKPDPKDKARIVELEKLVDANGRRLATLEQELKAALTREPVVVERIKYVDRASKPKEGIPYGIFIKMAERLLGKDWEKVSDRIGASAAMVKRWKREDDVPLIFLEKLSRARTFEVEKKRVEPKKRLDIRV